MPPSDHPIDHATVRTNRSRPAGSADDAHGGSARPNGAVNGLVLLLTAVAAGLSYTAALTLAPRLPQVLPALPVFYSFAISGGVVATCLLVVRARAADDELLRWMAWGYAVAVVAMALQILAFPTISPEGGPLRTTSTGAAALYLMWHTVVPVFALLGVGHRRLPRRVRPAAVVTALALVLYVATGGAILPTFFTADNRYTAALVGTLGALAALSLVATVVWAKAAGRRPPWTSAWITVSLAFSTWDLVLHAFAEERFTVLWWASLSMRLAQFVVLAAGLLTGFVLLFRALERYSTSLAARLESEAERARREHTEWAEHPVLPTEATRRVRAVLEDPDAIRSVLQPVVDLRTSHVVGFEALARFITEPARPPNVWFDEADAVGLGVDLELAALRASLGHLGQLPQDVFLAVNLSPQAAVSHGLQDCLRGAPLHRLVLEITEHAPVSDYDRLTPALDALRGRGCRLAVDDAGAGYASFRHILRLAPDLIKLDISLTRDLETDPVKRALARSLVDFAAQSGAAIIAEGVENAAQLAVLTELGVAYAQGYHLGRPGALADTHSRRNPDTTTESSSLKTSLDDLGEGNQEAAVRRLLLVGRRRSDRGAAAVEFALLLPILFLLVMGIIQFGWYFYVSQNTADAASHVARRLQVGDCWTGDQALQLARVSAPQIDSLTKSPTDLTVAVPGQTQIQVTVVADAAILNFISMPNNAVVTETVKAQLEDSTEDTPCL